MFKRAFGKAFVLTLGVLSSQLLQGREPDPRLGRISKLTSRIISNQHYSQRTVDDTLSSQLFDEFFKSLDPSKVYFTQDEIAVFEPHRTTLDNEIERGQVSFAFEVYDLYKKKQYTYRDYAKNLLASGFDFSKDEEFASDRSEQPWVKNNVELKELWRKKLKNEILSYKIAELNAEEKKDELNPFQVKKKNPKERALARIEQFIKHLDQNEDVDVLEMFLVSFCKVYDPHSTYMKPRTQEDFQISMRLSFGGIGAMLKSEDGYTSVVRLIKGGPAEKSGALHANDRIIAVSQNGEDPLDIVDMPLSKVVSHVRGKIGSIIYLTILEASKGVDAMPKVITIKRGTVELKDSEATGHIETYKHSDGIDRKVGVINLPSFYMDFDAAQRNEDFKSSTKDVKKIISGFKKEGIDGLVFDIRSNGGGSLYEAINLTGLFIHSGPVVQVKGHGGSIKVERDPDPNIFYDGPMIVLMNKLSASASEIFAGAMQDYNRAILVGDSHTHGKGTVQTVQSFDEFLPYWRINPPAGSIKYTNAKFYRVNGESTQKRGVLPDIVFSSFTDSMDIGEGTLDHALPWDTINALSHKKYNTFSSDFLAVLKDKSEKRRQSDNEFKALANEIQEFERMKKKKTISLNEGIRKKLYLKEKELQARQSEILKLDKDDEKEQKVKDIFLAESIAILNDLINKN